jgi:hypothetical protein
MSLGLCGSKVNPALSTISATAPARLANTGVPQLIASSAGKPNPSENDGKTSAKASE